jgi:hypothetical protein
MTAKPKPPKLTDAERHARFKEAAREVGASEKPEDFDGAFNKIVPPPKPKDRGGNPPPT